MTTAHKDFPHFFATLDPSAHPGLFTSWKGDVVRQALPRWLSTPFRLTGLGSVLKGGRWSVRGLMPPVYASTDPATLADEANYKGLKYGWTPADFLTQLRIGMHWELQRVVDLTLPATLAALKVCTADLMTCDWEAEQIADREALTQAIARAAFERLAEGLVVPSARHPGGVNIAYFPSHRLNGTLLELLNPDALPPDMHGLDP